MVKNSLSEHSLDGKAVRNVVITVSHLHLPNGLVTSTQNLADALIDAGYNVEFFLQWGADPLFNRKYRVFQMVPGAKFTHYMKGFETSKPILKPLRYVVGAVLTPFLRARARARLSRLGASQTVVIGAALESFNFLHALVGSIHIRKIFQLHMSFEGLTPANFDEINKALLVSSDYSVLSHEDGDKLEKSCGGKSHFIPNIINISNEKSSSSNQKVVYAGRFTPEKQVDHIIEAFKQINDREWTLEIYGSGPEESKLRALAKTHDRIKINQPVEDIKEIFQDASINMLTSTIEGFGMVIVEAGQYGVPTIAYDVAAGVRNAIGGGGVLVPAQDKECLKSSLELLMSDENRRKDLAEKALHHSQEFKPHKIVRRWEETFQRLNQ